MKFPKRKDYRKRITREDDLLISRTSVFLVTNGLLITAFGISDEVTSRLILSVLGLFIVLIWAICSWQNWRVIRDLTRDYRKIFRTNYLEEIVQDAMFKPGWRRPTFLISIVLPVAFLLTWLLLLGMHLLKLFKLLILF